MASRLPKGFVDWKNEELLAHHKVLTDFYSLAYSTGLEIVKFPPVGYQRYFDPEYLSRAYAFDDVSGRPLQLANDATYSLYRWYADNGGSRRPIAFVAPVFRLRRSGYRHWHQIGFCRFVNPAVFDAAEVMADLARIGMMFFQRVGVDTKGINISALGSTSAFQIFRDRLCAYDDSFKDVPLVHEELKYDDETDLSLDYSRGKSLGDGRCYTSELAEVRSIKLISLCFGIERILESVSSSCSSERVVVYCLNGVNPFALAVEEMLINEGYSTLLEVRSQLPKIHTVHKGDNVWIGVIGSKEETSRNLTLYNPKLDKEKVLADVVG